VIESILQNPKIPVGRLSPKIIPKRRYDKKVTSEASSEAHTHRLVPISLKRILVSKKVEKMNPVFLKIKT
jgi:hypothetical protein